MGHDQTVKCPACGMDVNIRTDQSIAVCLSCGKVMRIPDDVEPATSVGASGTPDAAKATLGSDGQSSLASQSEPAGAAISETGASDESTKTGVPFEPQGDGDGTESRSDAEETNRVGTGHASRLAMPEPEGDATRPLRTGKTPKVVPFAGTRDDSRPDAASKLEEAADNEPTQDFPTDGRTSSRVASVLTEELSEPHRDDEPTQDFHPGRGSGSAGPGVSELDHEADGLGGADVVVQDNVELTMDCPNCGSSVVLRGRQVVEGGVCPSCRSEVRVPAEMLEILLGAGPNDPLKMAGLAAAGSGSSLGKAIAVASVREVILDCPVCGTKVTLRDDVIDRGATCPSCGAEIHVDGSGSQWAKQGAEASGAASVAASSSSNVLSPSATASSSSNASLPSGQDIKQVPVAVQTVQSAKPARVAMILIGVISVLGVGVMAWLLMVPGTGGRKASRVERSLVTGRLIAGGKLGHWAMTPSRCLSGQAHGYNGVELGSRTGGPIVRIVKTAEGYAVISAAGPTDEAIKFTNCELFDVAVVRTQIRVNGVQLLNGHARLLCKDKNGVPLLRGSVTFQRCQ
ncbi:MAG: hypothetical protein J7M25_02455 [Deltaproteobacteria bacterium]|nr:hypothetical protein [Deltaproteobacteria bacterium]